MPSNRYILKTLDGQLIKKSSRPYLISNITALSNKYRFLIIDRPDTFHSTKMALEIRKGYYDYEKAKKYFP